MIERLQHSAQFLAEHWIGFAIAFVIWAVGLCFIVRHAAAEADQDSNDE